MLGQFEASLRRRVSTEEGEEKLKKHSCCSGHAHGHGVRKERSVREVTILTRERRNCSLPPESSSDEGNAVPDLLLGTRAASLENRRASLGSNTLSNRRSSKDVMQRMLYGNATKEDLKNRRIEEDGQEVDSGLASGGGEEEEEEEEDARELRRQQRQERREYYQRHSPKTKEEKANTRRTVSPSPGKRRGSVESSRDSSTSPPLTPPSTASKTLPRRTKSTSLVSPNSPSVSSPRKASTGGGYAFGSSTKRFKAPEADSRGLGSSESLASTSHSSLTRTTSDSRMGGTMPSPKKKLGPSHKNSVTKAWLQFQEDIEAAMLRKPGGGSGLYKNLTDLMADRMEQLDQVNV